MWTLLGKNKKEGDESSLTRLLGVPVADDEERQRKENEFRIAVEQYYKQLENQQRALPPWQRANRDELWRQAKVAVKKDFARARRQTLLRRLGADVRSAWTRNRHLWGPWEAGLAYVASGEAGAIVAEAASVAAGEGVAVTAAATTTAALWRKINRLPTTYLSRFRAGLLAGCATCLSLPVLPWDYHGIDVAAGVGALIASSARYWRDHEPSYPPKGGQEAQEAASVVAAQEREDTVPGEAQDIIDDWNTFIRDGTVLTGAELEFRESFKHGYVFTVQLKRGKQKTRDLKARVEDIAAALNRDFDTLMVDPVPGEPLRPQLTVITSRPDNTYRGPVVAREGSDVYIELGPYQDGRGIARYKILSDQLTEEELARGGTPHGSAIGGFILGDKGSGKSRLMEIIALGAKALGVQVWYLDPQGGASSPLLRDHASWSLMGLDSPDGRAFGNVEDLLEALEGVVAVRQDENALNGWSGFQHSKERPMILVVIDECHIPFEEYGGRFGEIDRIARKVGIAFLGASQAPTQDVFGGSITLRNGMAGSNGFVLKYNGSNPALAFGGLDQVVAQGCQKLPANRGLGYALHSGRPHAVFQSWYTPDLEPFFQEVDDVALDQLAAIGAGEAYARRHEVAQQNLEAVRKRLEGYLQGTLKPSKVTNSSACDSGSGSSLGGNIYLFPGTKPQTPPQSAEPEPEPEPELTDRQRTILEMLTNAQLTAKQLAGELGVTPRTVSNDLRVLREHQLVRCTNETAGIYTAGARGDAVLV